MADSPRLNNDEALVHRDIEFALEATEAAANIFSAPLLPSDIISPSTTSRRLVSAMTRHTDNQDPRNSQFTREFAYKVQRDWVRVKNPCTVITEDLPTYVRSLTVRPNTLSRRVANSVPQYAGVWVFEVRSDGMPLRNIALVLNEHRENFYIASVKNERGQSLGMCDGQEWFDNSSAAVSATSHWEQRATNSHNTETQLPMPSFCYNIEIAFASTAYGTYRQNVLFGFGGYPVIRRRICIDCVHVDDMNRLTEATKYILQQTANSWTSTEAGGVHQFESPFVLGKDPRETYLEKAYPYPMENDFMLSNATLSEDSITPTNYRGRMHELISVEELARHEQIARYNRVTTIKLSMSYILASDTDGSTTAKYAPPGELFAEVGISFFKLPHDATPCLAHSFHPFMYTCIYMSSYNSLHFPLPETITNTLSESTWERSRLLMARFMGESKTETSWSTILTIGLLIRTRGFFLSKQFLANLINLKPFSTN